MMRLSLLPFIFSVSLPLTLQAAQYEFPVDSIRTIDPARAESIGEAGLAKMKEFSKFPMPFFEVKSSPAGQIHYQLPKVLTGKTVDVFMDKISEINGVRSYKALGGIGEGTCTGPLETPTCKIELADLDLNNPSNVTLRNQEIDATYRDPATRRIVRDMGDLFSEQMPIGVIFSQDSGRAPNLQGRWWNGSYSVENGNVAHELCFYQKAGLIYGQFRVTASNKSQVPCGVCPTGSDVAFCGDLDSIKMTGNLLVGNWKVSGSNGQGWIEFLFDKKLGFKGSYGNGWQGPRQGKWNGQVRP